MKDKEPIGTEKMKKKCCKDYKGDVDITNSCIFCKTYLGEKTKVLNTRVPNPGTDEAREQGCKCPVMDNDYGRGWDGGGKEFIYNMDCELHSSGMWIDKDGLHIG